MKKIIGTLCLIAVISNLQATIRTVSNNPSTIAQFNTIQAAITASAAGDTVYVHASPTGYAGFTIADKRLVIMGPGMVPGTQGMLTAIINSGGISISGAASSNSELHGLVISLVSLNINSGTIPTGLKFYRNSFDGQSIYLTLGGTTYSGYIFENNFFKNAFIEGNTSSNYQDFIFQNNLILSNFSYSIRNIMLSTNVLFNHNLWVTTRSSGNDICFLTCSGLLLTNNIFVRRDAADNASSCTFTNNITFYPAGSTPPSAPWTINGNIDGGGNIHNQDPQMVDQAVINAGGSSYLTNYTIPAGPANNSGSDGKDMGLLFNVPPDPRPDLNWTVGLKSRIPYLSVMNITNPVIGSGGTLNVAVEARKTN
jgi:hypothetical protein